MKLFISVVKSFKENMRSWKILSLVILFAPFFLVIMYFSYGTATSTYTIGIINNDLGAASKELINSFETVEGQYGDAVLTKVKTIKNQQQLEFDIKEKTIDIGIIIPKDYSEKIIKHKYGEETSPAIVDFYGSMGNPKYTVAVILVSDQLYKQGLKESEIVLPIEINETFVEKTPPLNEFDAMVPGLISLSILMILFTATASIVKEKDQMTLIRIKLSGLGVFNFLAGTSIVQVVVAFIAVMISYLTALGLGYQSAGSLELIIVVSIISCFSMVAVSLIMASFLNTILEVLTIGCFPFFLMMFFSGGMFPLPKSNIISIGGYSFGLADLLPLTHTAGAFNKIMNFGASISQILPEIIMLIILTVIYFVIGTLLYQRRRLSKK